MLKKSLIGLLFLSIATPLIAAPPASSTPLEPLPQHTISTRLITQFINDYHYKQTELTNQQSKLILEKYLTTLDPNRSFFTQQDIDSFERYQTTLDDALKRGDMSPAFDIFQRYSQRRIERADYALSRLPLAFDFTIDELLTLDRSESSWAANGAALDEIWRKRVKNDVLNLMLANKEPDDIQEVLQKRYQRIKTHVTQTQAEDAYEYFINAYLRSIEPHTGYFSPRNSENFKINMSLSLEGIGAVLRIADEMTTVQKIIPGGPADLSQLIHAKDRITGVAQGEEGEMEDVVGWRLDDVVDLIRGPKDSIVRLQLLPKESGLDGPSKIITLKRNKIKLEEQQAKKSIIELPGNGAKKIGVISIPTFYMDFEGYRRGDDDYRSTTRDALALIEALQQQGIDGLIIDLRNNGGGSLPEAVALTGLFIKEGPVVQIRDGKGKIKSDDDTDANIAYLGPLAVLVNRYSASASEIFAGAIQDYGRGVIIGEPTYGKGTVQTMVDLNRYVRSKELGLGQLKLTMAQFFRVNGDSTQHRGVIPDIQFPTAEQDAKQGERSYDNALPWATIKPAKFTPYRQTGFQLNDVIQQHQQRITTNSGFEFLLAQAEQRHIMEEKKSVTLLKEQRKQERKQLEESHDQRINTFRVAQGLAPLQDDEKVDEEAERKEHESTSDALKRVELQETALILSDIIDREKTTSLSELKKP
ncbi:MAG: carboxy terminal-processing peptidase [Gammaproteobacteria bacterium]|nr:carboxy terminal-processing peptidase [Gammaproteobacteria bacterium]MCF6229383.1 carboxy terminal-processing peptidase [Gammaproteobacteria bacterium]